MAFNLSSAAQEGFANAASYDTHRPSYPPEAVDQLVTQLGLKGLTDGTVIDLAAGTGKFTELLAAREEGFEILAVEPHNGMRKELERKQLKGVKVFGGNSEKIPLEDGEADALIAAQAFHWFANEQSLREIHRVLRPGGTFGMIWNQEDYNQTQTWKTSSKWESDMRAITWSFDDNNPRFRHDRWRQVFESQPPALSLTSKPALPEFSLPLGEHVTPWTVWLTPELLWDRYRTLSQIAILEGEEAERVKSRVFQLAREGEGVERNEKGEVAVHGVTYAAWTSRV